MSMKEVLLIGAGTRGAKQLGGRFQPYVPIRGKACVAHVVDAALEAESIDTIVVWGERERLGEVLAPARVRGAARGIEVVLLSERRNFVESLLCSYLFYLERRFGVSMEGELTGEAVSPRLWEMMKGFASDDALANRPVNLLSSDVPLIRPGEIDAMVRGKNPRADLILGRTVKSAVDGVLARLPEPFRHERAVKNYYTYVTGGRSMELIVNNFMGGHPLRVPRDIWQFAGQLFDNRTIIEGGRFNLNKIRNNIVLFKSAIGHLHAPDGERSALGGLRAYRRLKAFSFLVRAYLTIIRNRRTRPAFRDLEVLEEKLRILTDCRIAFEISDCFGPVMDIDTDYEVEYIERYFDLLCGDGQPAVHL